MPPQPLRVECAYLELDGVGGEVGGRARVDGVEPLADREAERQLLVVPGRAHGHRDRLAVDPDLERLLDRDEVALPRRGRMADDLDGRGGVRDAHRPLQPRLDETCPAAAVATKVQQTFHGFHTDPACRTFIGSRPAP